MRPPHASKTLLLLLAVLAAAMSLTAAVAVAGGGKSDKIKAPKLKPVPKVVHTRTTRKPPRNVKFRGQPVPAGITSGTETAAGGLGDVVLAGVPGYRWRDGCAPTSVGMIVGFYDLHGWGDLIPGDASTNTLDVQQAIATHGTAETPGHYDDYALPKETSSSIAADRSEAPIGDEHVSNCIADFMHTSWSSDGLPYGSSWSTGIARGFTEYARSRYPSSNPVVSSYSGASLTWDLLTSEIDSGRPMALLVDSSGDGTTDHCVTVVGYREVNGYPEYGCWDTWSTTLLRWQQYRGVSSSYSWGVWGGYTFKMSAPSQEPSPTPTPTPTPAVTDTEAPVTTPSGADEAWHNTTVTVSFVAADQGSGIAYTEYSLDNAPWVRSSSVTIVPPNKSAAVHTIAFRSADKAGNVEVAKAVQVKQDTVKPVTSSNADTKVHLGSYQLVLSARDANSGVSATYYSVDGGAYQAGTSVVVTGAGRHTVRFFSLDRAGNREDVRSASVRIG